jgi:hypothetical protein
MIVPRLVLRYTTGPFSGLRQIVGTVTDLSQTGDLPSLLSNVELSDGRHLTMVRELPRPRYVVYREQEPPHELVLPDPTLCETGL